MLSWPARELWRGERVVKSAVNRNNNNNTNNNNKASYLLSYLTLRDKIPEVSSVRLQVLPPLLYSVVGDLGRSGQYAGRWDSMSGAGAEVLRREKALQAAQDTYAQDFQAAGRGQEAAAALAMASYTEDYGRKAWTDFNLDEAVEQHRLSQQKRPSPRLHQHNDAGACKLQRVHRALQRHPEGALLEAREDDADALRSIPPPAFAGKAGLSSGFAWCAHLPSPAADASTHFATTAAAATPGPESTTADDASMHSSTEAATTPGPESAGLVALDSFEHALAEVKAAAQNPARGPICRAILLAAAAPCPDATTFAGRALLVELAEVLVQRGGPSQGAATQATLAGVGFFPRKPTARTEPQWAVAWAAQVGQQNADAAASALLTVAQKKNFLKKNQGLVTFNLPAWLGALSNEFPAVVQQSTWAAPAAPRVAAPQLPRAAGAAPRQPALVRTRSPSPLPLPQSPQR